MGLDEVGGRIWVGGIPGIKGGAFWWIRLYLRNGKCCFRFWAFSNSPNVAGGIILTGGGK